MPTTSDARDLPARLQRLDDLIREVERLADPAARDHARALVRAVLDLHSAGLERVLGLLGEAGAAGAAVLDACARDELVAGLLVLHGLHPDGLEARVLRALEQVRPYLRSHGGNVELIGVDDGVVSLRLAGSCHGCPSSAVTMRQTIEEAILAHAPDVTGVSVEGAVEEPSAAGGHPALVVLQ